MASSPRSSEPSRPRGKGRPSSQGRTGASSDSGKRERPTGRGPSSRSGDGGKQRGGSRRDEAAPDPADLAPRQWGSLARKGTRRLQGDPRGAGTAAPGGGAPTQWEPETWIDEGPVRRAAQGAVRRGGGGASKRPGPTIDTAEVGLARGVSPKDAARLEVKLKEAAKAYEGERYGDARKLLVPLVERMPGNAAVRELLGLTYYRMGRWKEAIAELETFRTIEDSTEQHPVLADCYRALKRWADADALWEELRAVSPSSELVTEGRIVAAGTLADRNRLPEAIALLDKGFRFPKHPRAHHLRRAYALADLRERAGDLPQARSLFQRIAALDPEFGDVEDRVRALR